jgi:hypothetical protein
VNPLRPERICTQGHVTIGDLWIWQPLRPCGHPVTSVSFGFTRCLERTRELTEMEMSAYRLGGVEAVQAVFKGWQPSREDILAGRRARRKARMRAKAKKGWV